MIRIIAEMGSTHMGKVSYAKEAIDFCIENKIDAIKFQLFPNDPEYTSKGNIFLHPEMFLEIYDYAKENHLECSASVFDSGSLGFLLRLCPPFIKFAYSRKMKQEWIKATLDAGIEAIVSCDVMTADEVTSRATKLFCISEYPVLYQIAFDELFPRFQGFSDHTLGCEQTVSAVAEGAKIIEKHMTLNHSDITCPDSKFALYPGEFSNMVARIRQMERI